MAYLLRPQSELVKGHVALLAPLLDDTTENVRAWAVIALSTLGSGQAIQLLSKRAKSESNPAIQKAMVLSVARRSAAQAGIFMTSDFLKRTKRHDSARGTPPPIPPSDPTRLLPSLSIKSSTALLQRVAEDGDDQGDHKGRS